MFKIMIMIILIMSCGTMGLIKSGNYTKRLNELNDFRSVLKILDTEINYRKEPLSLIFQRFSNQKDSFAYQIMYQCYDYLKTSNTLSESWNKSIETICKDSCLNKHDIEIICELGTYLGQSNSKEQSGFIKLVDEKLQQQIIYAKEDKETKGRMYRGLGFSAGIAIAVLLI